MNGDLKVSLEVPLAFGRSPFMTEASLHLPLRDANLQAFLHHKKRRMVLQILIRSQQLVVVVTEQQWQRLVHLEQCQILANAEMTTASELFSN